MRETEIELLIRFVLVGVVAFAYGVVIGLFIRAAKGPAQERPVDAQKGKP